MSLILSILYRWSTSILGGLLKFDDDSIELSFNGIDDVGDMGLVATFLSLDLFSGFLGILSLDDEDCYLAFFWMLLELEDIEISKALSLIRRKAPTNSAADLSEFEVACRYMWKGRVCARMLSSRGSLEWWWSPVN